MNSPFTRFPNPFRGLVRQNRNFYDRSYFNAHDRTGDIFLISGIGYYPNLGVKDAFVLVRRGDTQTAVHVSDGIDSDRLNQHVLGYRVEVSEPLHKLRVILEETDGIAVDLTGNGLFDVIQEQRHVMRTGTRITLDAQRFAQVGSWSGVIAIDGEEIAVDPKVWIGSRDRSWGIRPIGEPEPAGRPAHPPFEGMWWLYVPMAFDDFAICLIIQRRPTASAVSTMSRVSGATAASSSSAGRGSRSTTPPAPAFRPAPPSRRQRLTAPPFTSTWSPSCRCRSTSAADTAATRTGCTACGRATSSPSALPTTDGPGDRRPGGLRRHRPRRPRAVCTEGGKSVEGWGLFEHGALGRHDPSGFADWLTVAR